MLYTGLRVSETAALEWRDLILDATPAIRLRAGTTKSKRADEIELRPELAAELKEEQPPFALPTDRVFRSTPTLKTFKADLARAGIPLKDATGRTIDRHALRTTFVSWLGAAGVDIRVAQRLARHTSVNLTAGVYQDTRLLDTRGAIGRLLRLSPAASREAATQLATGTFDADPFESAVGAVVRPVVLKSAKEGAKTPAIARATHEVTNICHETKMLNSKGKTAISDPKNKWSRRVSNPLPSGCKPDALPTELRPLCGEADPRLGHILYRLAPGFATGRRGQFVSPSVHR